MTIPTHTTRFIMLGGFLGSGKTTSIARLAHHYQSQGLRVAIVTNDQAANLVDTYNLKLQGFNVGEMAGACFCGDLNALIEVVRRLGVQGAPDVCLVEPIGSCTDMLATVIRPLAEIEGLAVRVAPYGVIVKPSHARRILSNQTQAGFSPKAAYVFRKQLEEADFLIINRIDELAGDDVDALERLVNKQYPAIGVLQISAKTGHGFAELCQVLDQPRVSSDRVIELDYEAYAEAESELGWLNCTLHVAADASFPLDEFLHDLLTKAKQKLGNYRAEVAHLKAIGMADGAHAIANLVSSESDVEVSKPSNADVWEAEVVVNARIAIDPLMLSGVIRGAINDACQARQIRAQFGATHCFRPGRPLPVQRTTAV